MRLEDLKSGVFEPGDCGNRMDQPPDWMDFEKFNRGREFVKKHLFAAGVAMHLSLTAGFSVSNLLIPLMYTNQSHTPEKSLKRYVSTFEFLVCWFNGENIWDPNSDAHKAIRRVRKMHNRVATSMNNDDPDRTRPWISQYDMALGHSGFMAALIMYPDEFGVKCTKSELEDYIFYWRGLGYLLGTADEFNICSGDFHQTYDLCKEIEQKVLIPALQEPPKGFQLMADAYSEGLNIPAPFTVFTTKSSLAAALAHMRLPLPEMGWLDWMRYFRYALILWMVRWCPGFERFLNWHVMDSLKKVSQKYVHQK